ncbi:unnamed protein product [Gordionus sp. m RMFG-2023]
MNSLALGCNHSRERQRHDKHTTTLNDRAADMSQISSRKKLNIILEIEKHYKDIEDIYQSLIPIMSPDIYLSEDMNKNHL